MNDISKEPSHYDRISRGAFFRDKQTCKEDKRPKNQQAGG